MLPFAEPIGAQPPLPAAPAGATESAACERSASTSSPLVSPSQLTSERRKSVGSGEAVAVAVSVAVAVGVGDGDAVGVGVGDAVGEGDGDGVAVGVVAPPTVMMPRIEVPWTWQK